MSRRVDAGGPARKRKNGESVTLHCERCGWGTELPLQDTEHGTQLPCAHCGETLHWNECPSCGLCYLGKAEPHCPSCDDPSLEELEW
jgi:hypothetical protein